MSKDLQVAFTKTMVRDENGNIFIEPLCDFFGIQRRHQIDKIRNDRICQNDMQKSINFSAFGNNYPRICLGKKGFIRWIQILTPAILRPELQELFIEYQAAVFEYLYEGTEARNRQLEDIRDYTLNINHALRAKQQLTEYITEQKQHRNICLANTPEQWAKVKSSLHPQKSLPQGTGNMKAISAALPNNLEELKRMKKNIQTNIFKVHCLLDYQSKSKKAEKNPMPDGYKREVLNVRMREYETQIEEINQKIVEILKTK